MAKKKLTVILVILITAVVTIAVINKARDRAGGENDFYCENSIVDVGEIWPTGTLNVDFRFINRSRKETFTLSQLVASCHCMDVQPQSLTVPPGGSAALHVVVNTNQATRGDPSLAYLTEAIAGVGKSDAGREIRVQLRINATVKPPYTAEPTQLVFGKIIDGSGPQEKSFVVTCLSQEPVGRLELVSVPTGFSARTEKLEGGHNKFQVIVTCLPERPLGPISERVSFRAHLPSGPFLTRSVQINGYVVDDLQCQPPSLLFGTLGIDQTRTMTLSLISSKGEQFDIVESDVSSPSLRVAPHHPVGDNGNLVQGHSYDVLLQPSEAGHLTETVRFRARAVSGREHWIDVPVTAYVTAAQSQASPNPQASTGTEASEVFVSEHE